MPSCLSTQLTALPLLLVACQARGHLQRAPVSETTHTGIDRPIPRELLIRGRFVAFSDFWAIPDPGGDPIQFRPDGGAENRRAGLAGRWVLLNDSTVQIGGSRFHHRRAERDLFSPLPVGVRDSSLPPDGQPLGTRITAVPVKP